MDGPDDIIALLLTASKNTGLVANNVDFDQMSCSAASDLGLHCLLKITCRTHKSILSNEGQDHNSKSKFKWQYLVSML